MKIAVCLFGHLRTYKECYKSLHKNLLDKYDCDVFMHTWSKKQKETSFTENFYWVSNEEQDTTGLQDELFKKYNLKDLVIEDQQNREEEYGYYTRNDKSSPVGMRVANWNVHCMYHTMSAVNKMRENYQKENGVKYDFVLFTRPDILFVKEFKIENYIHALSQEEIDKSFFLGSGPMWNTRVNDIRMHGGGDYLFFASPDAISDIFTKIPKMLENFKDGLVLKNRTAENLFHFLIIDNGYNFWNMDYLPNRDFFIIRNKAESLQMKTNLENTAKVNENKKNKPRFLYKIKLVIYTIFFLFSFIPFVKIIFKRKKYFGKINKYYKLLWES